MAAMSREWSDWAVEQISQTDPKARWQWQGPAED